MWLVLNGIAQIRHFLVNIYKIKLKNLFNTCDDITNGLVAKRTLIMAERWIYLKGKYYHN